MSINDETVIDNHFIEYDVNVFEDCRQIDIMSVHDNKELDITENISNYQRDYFATVIDKELTEELQESIFNQEISDTY